MTATEPMSTPARGHGGRPVAGPRPATVCQVLHSLSVGGAEVLAMRLARRLAPAYRFVFACLDDVGTLGEELRAEGVAVHLLERNPGVDRRCARRLARLYRAEGVDLVHAHQYTPFFYSAAARLPWRRPPVLFTEHGRWHPDRRRPRRVVANRLLLGRRDRVVGVGESVRRALVRNEGVPARRVGVIYNGVDLSAFSTPCPDREALRREVGVGPGELLILQVARLDALKDHATALRALGHVARARPDARLVLVGEGPEESAIRELARREGLGPQLRMLGLRTDVARLLPAADLFLLTSISEGTPVTLIEAMSAGLPVVSTDVGGVGEVVADGTTGLLAPSGDAAALAEHVLRLAGDPTLRSRLGESGRERAWRLFGEATMHAGYQRLYEEILRGR